MARPARRHVVIPMLIQRHQRAVLAAAQAVGMDPNDILKSAIVDLEDVVRRASSTTNLADANYTKTLFPEHHQQRAKAFK